MRLPKLDIITGDVVNVQLTTETHVAGSQAAARGKRGGGGLQLSSRVLNRMRVFLMTDGKERDFTFTNSTVGIREGHRVSIVRAGAPNARDPVLVMLHNHSTGQREEMTGQLRRAVAQKTLSARWRALGAAVVVFVILIALKAFLNTDRLSVASAFIIAGLSFPVIWGVFAGLDSLMLPRQERDLADRLRAEIEGRLKFSEPPPAPPAH